MYEPGGAGGCTSGLDSRTRTSVTSANHKCVYATNGCFFNTSSGLTRRMHVAIVIFVAGQCHGNVVSDGRVVQVADAQMVNFGIRQDGTIVVGCD